MTKRSLLYSAAFIGLVAAGGATIPQAQAQKGIALQPSSQWAINKVAGTTESNGYCAMARRFRPNTILTVARNAKDEASIALDFQTPKFRQAEAMEVMIDPGIGQERAFEVYPVSNQAFVIRLGRDEAFFSALYKSGALRVDFGGKSYSFDLTDIDQGEAKLSHCVEEAGGAPRRPSATPVLSDNSYDRNVNDLRRQITQLEQTNQQLAQEPAQQAENFAASSPEFDRKDTLIIQKLSEQITALEVENGELEQRLAAFERGDRTALLAPAESEKIAKLTKENQDLRAALDTKQEADIQGEVLNDQIAALQSENNRLRQELAVAEAQNNPEKIAEITQENERLQQELALKLSEATLNKQLRDVIFTLEEENRALKKSPGSNQAVLQDNLKQIENLKDENKRLQNLVQTSEVSGDPAIIVRELKGQVTKLSAEAAAKDSKLLELGKLTTEVEMLKATNEQLEKQLIETALRDPFTRKDAMTHQIAALETQNDALMQQMEESAQMAADTAAADLETLRAENEELKKTIAESKTASEDYQRMQTELEALRKENAELKARTDVSASGDMAAQLQKALDDNKTLQAQLEQKESELAELASLREEVTRLRQENEQLKGGADVSVNNAAPNPEVENLMRENENLRAQIAGMGAKDTEIADLKTKLQEQEAKITAAEEAVKKAQSEAQAARDAAVQETQEAKAAAEAAQKQAEETAQAKAKEEADTQAREAQAKIEKEKAEKLEAAQVKSGAEVKAEVKTPEVEASAVPEPVRKEIVKEIVEAPKAAAEPVAQTASQAAPSPAIEQEMIRLENKLGEAHASGDQLAIQEAAREYMRLKSQMSASQELAAPSGPTQTEELLNYAGPAAVSSAQEGMSEAQRQEEAMLQAAPIEPPMAESEPGGASERLSARASEDPFADITIEDDGAGHETKGEDVSQNAPQEENTGNYNARMNETRSTSEQQSAAGIAPAPPNGSPDAEWAQSHSATPKVSAGGIYQPDIAVPQLLSQASVVPPEQVKVVGSASAQDKISYQWTADKVYGSAMQKPLSDPSRFDSEVQNYLAQTRKRCGEDFAAMPDQDGQSGDRRVATYEIACVGKGINSSASLIFFSQQGVFTVLAHEAPAENLDSAMGMRDRLLKAISGS